MARNAPEQPGRGSRVALVEHALPAGAREERLGRLLGAISRRLGRWAWADIHRRVRRGEKVKAFHRGLASATLDRLAGRGPQKEACDE